MAQVSTSKLIEFRSNPIRDIFFFFAQRYGENATQKWFNEWTKITFCESKVFNVFEKKREPDP